MDNKLKNDLLVIVSKHYPFSLQEVRDAYDLLNSIDLLIDAAEIARTNALPLITLVETSLQEGIQQEPREQLAELAHQQWSGWMAYLFRCADYAGEGGVNIPMEYAERWWQQMKTPYAELSEDERNSDRIEADKILAVFGD